MSRFIATLETGKKIPSAPKKILVPTDFSEESVAALRYAATLAQQSGGAIDVLHVWDSSSFADIETVGSIHDRAAETLQSFLLPFKDNAGISGNVTSGDPGRVVASLSSGYDLIVMGRKSEESATEVIVGSVARHVLADAKCPVLTVTEVADSHAAE